MRAFRETTPHMTAWRAPWLAIGALVGSLCLAAAAPAVSQQGPVEILRARNQTVESIVANAGDSISDGTRERLKDVINGIIDFAELSKRSLGRHWDERTERERADFTSVFTQLIRNSSVKKLEIYQADRMVYRAPEISGSEATVTTIAYRGRKQVEIVYRMHRVGGEWRVYDMEIDGVSTARNYRDSFYKEIAKSSYGAMYEKLVKRLEEQ